MMEDRTLLATFPKHGLTFIQRKRMGNERRQGDAEGNCDIIHESSYCCSLKLSSADSVWNPKSSFCWSNWPNTHLTPGTVTAIRFSMGTPEL